MAESRLYPERPIVAVGGVIFDGERVLLIKRANEPSRGEWSLPGGAVEVGESLEAALAREVREETCLDVTVGPVVAVLDRIRRDDVDRVEYHYVIVDYLCRPQGGTATCGSDADEVRWALLDDLASFHLTPSVVAVIEKARTR
jgi:8-oxo-dGTP diphosphatase